tara:strand:+ start:9477 stop:10439 length:963 start_codon:yes stop_codon:yes gene_type:complete
MNHIILENDAITDDRYGISPNDRSLESLLDAGVILVDKPRGPTSHQLTAWTREILGIHRLGHGGTLDPFATGLLTMLSGKATRLTDLVLTGDKRYIAVVRFGRDVDQNELQKTLENLTGEIYNVPPLESAVKVRVRTRIIHSFDLIDSEIESRLAVLSISCNAGTYIRTLARDMGLILSTSCELLELHRDRTGDFVQTDACTMQQLIDAVFLWKEHDDDRALKRLIAPVESILTSLPRIVVKDGAAGAISHGAALARPGIVSIDAGIEEGSNVVLQTLKGEAIAIAETRYNTEKIISMENGNIAQPKVVLIQPDVYPQTW